jgi:hypothetical protein
MFQKNRRASVVVFKGAYEIASLRKVITDVAVNKNTGEVVAFSFALMQKKQKIKDNPNRSASRMLSGSGHPTATSLVFWEYFLSCSCPGRCLQRSDLKKLMF